MDRQTLRDWGRRFNADGPDGLVDRKAPGAAPRLSAAQKAELAAMVEESPHPAVDDVLRWRCIDLKALIRRRLGVDYHARTVGKPLRRLGFTHINQRPRHHGRNSGIWRRSKKLPRSTGGDRKYAAPGHAGRRLVSRRGATRPEETPHPALGTPQQPTRRESGPAHCVGLSIRRHLPRTRHRCGGRHVACRHRSHAGASRRRSPAPSPPAHTPSYCSTRRVGTPRPTCTCRKKSPCSRCPRARRN